MKDVLQRITQGDLFGNNIRVKFDEDGEPWFVAADVCDVLGFRNPGKILKTLDDEDLDSLEASIDGQMREVNSVNESGLYNLIFMSREPKAQAFSKWLFENVLSTIRKHGRYNAEAE